MVLWISDKQDAFVKCVAEMFPDVPHRFCANHFFRDLAKPVLALDSTAKKKMRAKIRGLRALEREVPEAQQTHKTESSDAAGVVNEAPDISSLAGEGGAVVLDFCSAVRGILNDNHGGPCNPSGMRMVDALADVQDSLARIAASGKSSGAFSLLDRLKGFIDRGVAEQQETFSRVRGYTAQVREVVKILTVEDGALLADREPLFEAKIAELQSFSDDKVHHDMAKVDSSAQHPVWLFQCASKWLRDLSQSAAVPGDPAGLISLRTNRGSFRDQGSSLQKKSKIRLRSGNFLCRVFNYRAQESILGMAWPRERYCDRRAWFSDSTDIRPSKRRRICCHKTLGTLL